MSSPTSLHPQPSLLELDTIDDPCFFKNQAISLKFINSICHLPSLNDFTEITNKNLHSLEINYPELPSIIFKTRHFHEDLIEEHPLENEEKSIGSTNAYLSSGTHISIAETGQLLPVSPVIKKGSGCNCKKTGCLKMYCECFSSGKICTQQCNCHNCSNCDAHSETVKKAKQVAKNKHKFAFNPLQGLSRKFCNCRKTQCQKKYCECFNSGQQCNELCKCEDCLNGTHSPRSHRREGGSSLIC